MHVRPFSGQAAYVGRYCRGLCFSARYMLLVTSHLMSIMRKTVLCQVLLLILIPLILVSDNYDKCGTLNFNLASSLFAISDIRREDDINAPWLASVGRYTGGTGSIENYIVICSGSILTVRVIVTAGHCFQLKSQLPSHVRVGSNFLRYSEDRRIKEYKLHPKYEFPKYYFDIAVIILEVELKFSARISAICLPNPSIQPTSLTSLTVQGWGKNKEGKSGKGASEVREVLEKYSL